MPLRLNATPGLIAFDRVWSRMAGWASRFFRNTRGTAAIEFALVATPFFLTLFAMLEVSMIYLGSIALDNGTQTAARMIRTGQTSDLASFRSTVCAESFGLLSCGSKLFVDVQSYPSFAGVDLTPPVDADGNPTAGLFNAGNAGDVVVARTYYVWPIFTPGLHYLLANIGSSGNRLLLSTVAFRNEPYGGVTP